MASEPLSIPDSHSHSDSPSDPLSRTPKQLQDTLDCLWEKHLLLLDQYHQAQAQLQRHFSSAFFSLAQATFRSPTRTRYGRDYYDDRMQATRRVVVTMNQDGQPEVAVEKKRSPEQSSSATDDEGDEQEKDTASTEAPRLPTPPSTPSTPSTPLHQPGSDAANHHNPDLTANAQPCSSSSSSSTITDSTRPPPPSDHDKPLSKSTDPLHWYGILVPPQLRNSQSSFVAAVNGPLADAINAANAMRTLDVDIRKIRKDIKKAERKGALSV